MSEEEYIEKPNFNFSSLKEILSDLKVSIDNIVIWKETINERLTVIQEGLKYDTYKHAKESGDYLAVVERVRVLELKLIAFDLSNSREYFKSNLVWNTTRSILILIAGIIGTLVVNFIRKQS